MNKTIMPFPSAGGIIDKVIKAAKVLWNIVSMIPAKDAAKVDSVDKKSSIDDIEHIIEIFADFKEQVHIKAVEIENAANEEINFYIEELKSVLIENHDKVSMYGIRISRIEKKIYKIATGINGSIDCEISKRVSLDNVECGNIMKMLSGTKKEKAMSEFMNHTIREALSVYCDDFKENMEEIYDEVEEEVIGVVEHLQNLTVKNLKDMETISADNYQETAEKVVAQSEFVLDICGLTESIMGEV